MRAGADAILRVQTGIALAGAAAEPAELGALLYRRGAQHDAGGRYPSIDPQARVVAAPATPAPLSTPLPRPLELAVPIRGDVA